MENASSYLSCGISSIMAMPCFSATDLVTIFSPTNTQTASTSRSLSRVSISDSARFWSKGIADAEHATATIANAALAVSFTEIAIRADLLNPDLLSTPATWSICQTSCEYEQE